MTVVGVVCGLGPDGFLASHRTHIDAQSCGPKVYQF